MKIKEVIDYLETQGEWVNRDCTKDHILYGNENNDIHQAIVCWVATLDIIYQAIQNDCHFIISHENPFYLASTNLPQPIIKAQKKKKELLKNTILLFIDVMIYGIYIPNMGYVILGEKY
ncbi:hypothetical protein MBAG_02954 [Coprobacillus sp. D7]|nr:hypothetical protein MBAG_02954 [Coprobacillus sp. D7]